MYIPQLSKTEQVSRSPKFKSLDDLVIFYGLTETRKPRRAKAIRFLAIVTALVAPLGLILLG